MKNILFVDDEKQVLEGLRRMLRSMRKEWKMCFVDSGDAALKQLESTSFDVIVSDMRMPGMDGVQLLGEVRKRYPQVIRIALSGHSNAEMLLESVKATHQFLSKPCDAETLKSTVDRALVLEDFLHRDDLNKIVTGIGSLPSLPELYSEIMREVSSAEGSVARVGEIISKDISMTAKILQLVNSAFFGLKCHVESPAQATTLLGLDVIRGLVLTTQVFSELDQHSLPLHVEPLLQHSSQVGALAKKIAISQQLDCKSCDYALMAGMLHDIGKMVMANCFTEEYKQVLEIKNQQSTVLWQAELQVFGCSHGEIGAYLLGLWGLPNPIVEAVAFHHYPERSIVTKGLTPLSAVYIANALLDMDDPDCGIENLDKEYIQRVCGVEFIPQCLLLRDELLQPEDS